MKQKPICDISKCDNNMHFICTKARSVLKANGQDQQAEKLYNKFWAAGSRENMMEVLRDFVAIKGNAE